MAGGAETMTPVRATRAYIAGFGTAGSLLAGAPILFVLASAVVSFRQGGAPGTRVVTIPAGSGSGHGSPVAPCAIGCAPGGSGAGGNPGGLGGTVQAATGAAASTLGAARKTLGGLLAAAVSSYADRACSMNRRLTACSS